MTRRSPHALRWIAALVCAFGVLVGPALTAGAADVRTAPHHPIVTVAATAAHHGHGLQSRVDTGAVPTARSIHVLHPTASDAPSDHVPTATAQLDSVRTRGPPVSA